MCFSVHQFECCVCVRGGAPVLPSSFSSCVLLLQPMTAVSLCPSLLEAMTRTQKEKKTWSGWFFLFLSIFLSRYISYTSSLCHRLTFHVLFVFTPKRFPKYVKCCFFSFFFFFFSHLGDRTTQEFTVILKTAELRLASVKHQ